MVYNALTESVNDSLVERGIITRPLTLFVVSVRRALCVAEHDAHEKFISPAEPFFTVAYVSSPPARGHSRNPGSECDYMVLL